MQSASIQSTTCYSSQNAPHSRAFFIYSGSVGTYSSTYTVITGASADYPLKHKARLSMHTDVPSPLASTDTVISFTQTLSAEQIVTSVAILSAVAFYSLGRLARSITVPSASDNVA